MQELIYIIFLACEKFTNEIEGIRMWPLCCGSYAKLCFVFVPQLVLSWKGMVEKDIWNGLPTT